MPLDGTHLSPIAAALIAARQYLVKNGWCQYTVGNSQGNVCILGAFAYAGRSKMYWNDMLDRTLEDAIKTLELSLNLKPGWLMSWNDMPDRTLEEVLAAFDRAIARELVA